MMMGMELPAKEHDVAYKDYGLRIFSVPPEKECLGEGDEDCNDVERISYGYYAHCAGKTIGGSKD